MIELLTVALPAVPCALTVVNLVTWRRPSPGARSRRVSALVPARNERHTIEACVLSLLREPFDEVVVYDDDSTDGTGEILDVLALGEPRLRVLRGSGLPQGWLGKPHACQRLAEAATGEVFVFVDADTTLRPGALARLAAVPADVVSAFPQQRLGTIGERLLVPLLHLTYLSWLPLRLVAATNDPRVLAMNGQVLTIRRSALERTGGFAVIRGDIVDDMALGRAAKRAGLTVAFVDGTDLASCRMYTSFAEAWAGFTKNLYPGLGASPAAALAVALLYAGCFLLPYLAVPWAPFAAVAGITLGMVQRGLIAWRFRLPLATVVFHPLSVVLFLGLLFASARDTHRGVIRWRGRSVAHGPVGT